jgi:hypothetical protein
MLSLPLLDRDRLDQERLAAAEWFREERMKTALVQYLRAFETHETNLRRLLKTSTQLLHLRERAAEIVSDHGLLMALSGVAGPPISPQYLKELSGVRRFSSAAGSVDPTRAARVVETVLDGLDSMRFPWVPEGRMPTGGEERAAIHSSSAVLATLHVRAAGHTQSRSRREEEVLDALLAQGLHAIPMRTVDPTTDPPRPGEFCRESVLGGRRVDFLIGLWDKRLMALECHLSSSSYDSERRLRQEVGFKAAHWTREYDERIVAGVVLSGIFRLRDLAAVQDSGLGLFWSHHISELTDWIDRTRSQ